MHPSFKTHGQSHQNSDTRGTSGPIKWWLIRHGKKCLLDWLEFLKNIVRFPLEIIVNHFRELYSLEPYLSVITVQFDQCYSFFRKILNWIRQRAAKKAEKKAAEENLYTRWEQDKDLQTLPDMGLFSEYLEMGTWTVV